MKFDNIVDSIELLAPLSDATLEMQKMYADGLEELDINKLIALIETDSLLYANILKMANSPMYGFSHRITLVSQAVTLFGIMQIYGFFMNYVVTQKIRAKTEIFGFSNERFNDICNIQSSLLMQWYSDIDLDTARFLSPLALIMESGKLIIASEVIASDYEAEFIDEFKSVKDIRAFEKKLIGKTSYTLSSLIFKHWKLDERYVEILKNLDAEIIEDEKLQRHVDILNVIITAVNLKSILSKKSVLEACTLVKKMGLNPQKFADVTLKIKRSYMQELKSRV